MQHSSLDLDLYEIKKRYQWAKKHLQDAKYMEQKNFFQKEINECAFAAEQKHNVDIRNI
jgi:uncharacterized membrane protein YcaP (DUF421 family)